MFKGEIKRGQRRNWILNPKLIGMMGLLPLEVLGVSTGRRKPVALERFGKGAQ